MSITPTPTYNNMYTLHSSLGGQSRLTINVYEGEASINIFKKDANDPELMLSVPLSLDGITKLIYLLRTCLDIQTTFQKSIWVTDYAPAMDDLIQKYKITIGRDNETRAFISVESYSMQSTSYLLWSTINHWDMFTVDEIKLYSTMAIQTFIDVLDKDVRMARVMTGLKYETHGSHNS